jgi:hypothetical protein
VEHRGGARECWRRASEVLPLADSEETAVARAGLMAQENRVEQEEWLHEATERQIEDWLREHLDEPAKRGKRGSNHHDDDDDYEFDEMDDELKNEGAGALGVEGPVGSGFVGCLDYRLVKMFKRKSGCLARAAARTGFTVLEVNAGDHRSGRQLLAAVSEVLCC